MNNTNLLYSQDYIMESGLGDRISIYWRVQIILAAPGFQKKAAVLGNGGEFAIRNQGLLSIAGRLPLKLNCP